MINLDFCAAFYLVTVGSERVKNLISLHSK